MAADEIRLRDWAVYSAEDDALPGGGRRFRRFAEIESFVEAALADPFWSTRFPDAPTSVLVEPRSHTATASTARVTDDGWSAVISIRSGSWDAATVVHELAHVATGSWREPGRWGSEPDHGSRFVLALLDLWRHHLGLHAYGALRSALAARGVTLDHQ